MKTAKVLSLVILGVLICLVFVVIYSNSKERETTGTIISVPVSFSLEEALEGEIKQLRFIGDTVKVELDDGKVVEALATQEQMAQGLNGKTKAILKKTKDGKWKVLRLEENDTGRKK